MSERPLPHDHISYRINRAVYSAQNLAEVKTALVNLISTLHAEDPDNKIYFVSGVINASGVRNNNRKNLWNYSEYIREKITPWAFSSIDVFPGPVAKRIRQSGASGSDYARMFCEFIREASNKLGGMVLTPHFELAPGAVSEVETAREVGIEIIDLRTELS